jgi:hypothetical protein
LNRFGILMSLICFLTGYAMNDFEIQRYCCGFSIAGLNLVQIFQNLKKYYFI